MVPPPTAQPKPGGNVPFIRIGIAILAGMLVAQVLPFIYAPTVGLIQDVLQLERGGIRDSFNTFFMTVLTFLVSFTLSRYLTRPSKRAPAK